MPTTTGLNAADVSVTNTDNDMAGHHGEPDLGPGHDRGGRHGDLHGRAQHAADGERDDRAERSSDTTEGTVSRRALTFTAANWNMPQTVTVTGVDDSVVDGDVAYTIVTAAATSTDRNYNGLNAADVSVTNTDNDTAGITVTPTPGWSRRRRAGRRRSRWCSTRSRRRT